MDITPAPSGARRIWTIASGLAAVALAAVAVALAPSPALGLAVLVLVACGVGGVALLTLPPGENVIDLRDRRALTPPVLAAQVLFAHNEPGRITVDGTVLDVKGDRLRAPAPGTPFTLDLRAPSTAWFSASVGDLLTEWAERGEIVELELLAGGAGPRARLSRDEARLVLDLVSTAGLPLRPIHAA